jgi:CheY-like chemotaxis protein
VINARDAMSQGGRLTIETANILIDETSSLQPITMPPGHYVQLIVADTGTGINGQILPHIFEPFYTTKEPGRGTGLGLSTVYAIVTQSNGLIQVDSEPGQGTTFRIYLPRVSDSDRVEIRQEMGTPQAQAQQASKTILLVEDESSVRKLTKRILVQEGYHVLEAEQGNEALRICQQYDQPIHLILTDVVMPNSMSGRELAEQVELLLPETRVLYMSGYTDDMIVKHGISEANVNFLQKPFSASSLIRKVREILDTPE